MNAKLAKKVRKQVRSEVKFGYSQALDWLFDLPFRQRLGVAWNLVRGKRYWRG